MRPPGAALPTQAARPAKTHRWRGTQPTPASLPETSTGERLLAIAPRKRHLPANTLIVKEGRGGAAMWRRVLLSLLVSAVVAGGSAMASRLPAATGLPSSGPTFRGGAAAVVVADTGVASPPGDVVRSGQPALRLPCLWPATSALACRQPPVACLPCPPPVALPSLCPRPPVWLPDIAKAPLPVALSDGQMAVRGMAEETTGGSWQLKAPEGVVTVTGEVSGLVAGHDAVAVGTWAISGGHLTVDAVHTWTWPWLCRPWPQPQAGGSPH